MKKILRGLWFFALAAWIQSCHMPGPGVRKLSLADSILQTGQLKPLTDSISRDPRNPLYYFKRSELLYTMQQFLLSRRDLIRASRLDPREPGYYYALGEVNLALNSLDSAKQDYALALLLDKGDQQVRLRLADVMYMMREDSLAGEELDTLLRLDPKNAEGHGLISQVYEDQGDTNRAISEMQEAVKFSPGNYEALMAMGDLFSAVDQPRAVNYYRQAYLLDTDQGEPLYAMAVYFHKMNQDDQAIASLKQCISADHFYPAAYLELGKIYFLRSQFKRALGMDNLATKVDPRNAEAFYQMGLCYESAGNRKLAVTYYRQAYALDKTLTGARAALQRLR